MHLDPGKLSARKFQDQPTMFMENSFFSLRSYISNQHLMGFLEDVNGWRPLGTRKTFKQNRHASIFSNCLRKVNSKLPIMDRCSNRRGKSQRREGKAKEDQRRGKGIKYAKDGLFSNILRFRKVGSLKQPVRSHVAGWGIKNCRWLRRKTRFDVNMLKKHICGNCVTQKEHTAVAPPSAFRSQKAKKTP